MGVHGLWNLLEPVGKIIPLEGMAGKVLAIDVSIWLHQAIKGMHDTHGAPVAVAHLLILFHRLCKLLFYQIKPVFVFDGGVPALKRETMATRRKIRSTAKNEAMKVRGKLFKNLLKHEAVRQMLSHVQGSELLGLSSLALPGSSVEEELYRLPPLTEKQDEKSEDEPSSEEGELKLDEDIHTIDVTSSDFKNLPAEVRHEILMELIETRKQSSWKYIDSMPKESDSFSDFQMNRLLKRRAVQSSLDEVGKEMGGKALSMKELESLLHDQPNILQTEDFLPSRRIAQSEHARFLLIQKGEGDENATEEVKSEIKIEAEDIPSTSGEAKPVDDINEVKEELTQQEIYDLIKKENETLTPKESKLTKERKMKMTDDVKEILPLLGVKGKDKVGNIENISEIIVPAIIKPEKEGGTEVKDTFSLKSKSLTYLPKNTQYCPKRMCNRKQSRNWNPYQKNLRKKNQLRKRITKMINWRYQKNLTMIL
ncbi:UNVERIFIED_CONTAM: hypothetical protein PYX00_006165 [Menopon gallinae]|uniref:XPG N-terminal domain-containing protein n=1 Tax=Menopon gallinae TaxID=328185 RepID=A0AAW2HVL8_9NEOP